MNRLFESLRRLQEQSGQLDVRVVVVAIVVALITALIAAALYRFFYENRGTGSQIHRAFPLLGISITALFLCIQTSLPLSLGLLGALSIIRFRTPIREPEEVGFIMLVIAGSICCATFNFRVLLVLYLLAIATLLVVQRLRLAGLLGRDGLIVITLSNEQATQHLQDILSLLGRHVQRGKLESAASKADVTSLQYAFAGMKAEFGNLQRQLQELVKVDSVNVFYSRAGGVR